MKIQFYTIKNQLTKISMKKFHITFWSTEEKKTLGGITIDAENIILALEQIIDKHILIDGSTLKVDMIHYASEI